MERKGADVAGAILATVGTILGPVLAKGRKPKFPGFPKLVPCPFCGGKAGKVNDLLPVPGCMNRDCPVRPRVDAVPLVVAGVDLFSKEGAAKAAELWNRRARRP